MRLLRRQVWPPLHKDCSHGLGVCHPVEHGLQDQQLRLPTRPDRRRPLVDLRHAAQGHQCQDMLKPAPAVHGLAVKLLQRTVYRLVQHPPKLPDQGREGFTFSGAFSS